MLTRTTWARVTAVVAVLAFFAPEASAQQRPTTTWAPAISSNYRVGRGGADINFVIIHTVEGSAQGAISWFRNPASRVSAHYIIARSGQIFQGVRDSDTAWHAGWINSQAIGLEHEGWAWRNTWTDAQYRASAALTAWLCRAYAIPIDRRNILGHREVRGATHTDPGPFFNWTYYMGLVRDGGRQDAPAGQTAREVSPETAVVRDAAAWSGQIFGTVRQGQLYVANGESNGWRRIFYDNRTGWVWDGSLLRRTNGIGRRFNSTTSARSSAGGPIIGRVDQGEVFIANLNQNGWLRIWYAGGNAWVPASGTTVLYFP